MNQERHTENQFGIPLFTWSGWDEGGTDQGLFFHNVEFVNESMKKFNGCGVDKSFDGNMIIYDKETGCKELWKGSAIDIPEYWIKLLGIQKVLE